jgi:hypothetical protein
MTTASASGAAHITSTGSPRSEPRSEVLEIPRTKRRRPTLNAFSAIEVLVPYNSLGCGGTVPLVFALQQSGEPFSVADGIGGYAGRL